MDINDSVGGSHAWKAERKREGKLSPKPLRNVFIERTQKQTNRNERKRDINRKEPWTSGLVKGREDRK